MEELKVLCMKCGKPLVLGKVKFIYLGHELHSDVPKCPVCGQVYLSEKLVAERMRFVESSVEDK
jgi:hypothetical protein